MALDITAKLRNRKPITIAPILFTKTRAVDLAAIYLVVVRIWEDSADRLLASYTPQAWGDGLTLDTPGQNEAEIVEIQNRISAVILSLGARVREWTVRAERWHRDKWVSSVYSATNVDLSLLLTGNAVTETVESFIARNVALIKDVSAEAQRKISDAIFRGYQQRLPAKDVAAAMRDATDFGKDRSMRIAGDQMSKLSSALDLERQQEAGITLGQYRHSGKKHPRTWHKARNGLIYELKTRKQVNADGTPNPEGQTIPPDDWPGFPPFCGCRMASYLPIQAEIEPRP